MRETLQLYALTHRVCFFKIDFFFLPPACTGQSKPCALTHMIYEGNFGTMCGNAQGLHWQFSFHGWAMKNHAI